MCHPQEHEPGYESRPLSVTPRQGIPPLRTEQEAEDLIKLLDIIQKARAGLPADLQTAPARDFLPLLSHLWIPTGEHYPTMAAQPIPVHSVFPPTPTPPPSIRPQEKAATPRRNPNNSTYISTYTISDYETIAFKVLPPTPTPPPAIRRHEKEATPRRNLKNRPYITLSNRQTVALKKVFDHAKYISGQNRKRLAEGLGIMDGKVKMWFNTTRGKLTDKTGLVKNRWDITEKEGLADTIDRALEEYAETIEGEERKVALKAATGG